MELTQPVDWLQQPYVGYVVNTVFSENDSHNIHELIQEIKHEFGDAVFCASPESLHITLLDWIAPLVEYDEPDKAKLFDQVKSEYDQAMTTALSTVQPFTVTFNQIHISPTTIYITAEDSGQFQEIRQTFLDNASLLPGTKLPPTIIHSSLARFTKPIKLDIVKDFLAGKTLDVTQTVDSFRLVHTAREPMLEYTVLKTYTIGQL